MWNWKPIAESICASVNGLSVDGPHHWHSVRAEYECFERAVGQGQVILLRGAEREALDGIQRAIDSSWDIRFIPGLAVVGQPEQLAADLQEFRRVFDFYSDVGAAIESQHKQSRRELADLAASIDQILKSRRWRLGRRIGDIFSFLRGIPAWTEPDQLQARVRETLARQSPEGELRVTYVLPAIGINGGVRGVLQLVERLQHLGVAARVASVHYLPEAAPWAQHLSPDIYDSWERLIEELPHCDVAVATGWETAQRVHALVQNGRASTSAYFLQDYEAWFYPERDPRRARVVSSYDQIPNKIVKSDWLAELLLADGHATKKIHLGMNLKAFYPRPRSSNSRRPVVSAFARPKTPRRGFPTLIRALDLVQKQIPDTRFLLYGQDLSHYDLPFPYENLGLINDHEELAKMYSDSDVFLDASDFQAFGRPALEAMACGSAVVLTGVGGVTEYARHDENCLIVEPREPRPMAEAIVRLLRDDNTRGRCVRGGFETVPRFCMDREARQTKNYFEGLVRERAISKACTQQPSAVAK